MGSDDSGPTSHTSGAIGPDALLTAIIEMSDDAIVTCDGKGNVTSWSATAERLFGCLADDVLDDPFELLFPEHLADEVRGIIATVLAGDRVRNFESEILRPDGMPLPVSLSLSPVFDSQKVASRCRGAGAGRHRAAPGAGHPGRDRRADGGGRGAGAHRELVVGPENRGGAVERRVPPDPRRRPSRLRRDIRVASRVDPPGGP